MRKFEIQNICGEIDRWKTASYGTVVNGGENGGNADDGIKCCDVTVSSNHASTVDGCRDKH
jgi:hypothetical protein